MIKQINKTKIFTLMYSESPRKRIAGIKKSLNSFDDEIIDYLILLLQIDDNRKVRKTIIKTFSEMVITVNSLEQKIHTALETAKSNEPEKSLQFLAEQALEKRK